jgi:hypothetical protein
VEVVSVEGSTCVATANTKFDYDDMIYLSGKDLSDYDYISVSCDGLVAINVKPTSMTRLNNMGE